MPDESPANPELDPATWVDAYGDALYKFAYFRVNNTALAEDLVQETFLAAIKGKDRFSGKASVKTWLTGILKNKVIDYYRKKNRTQSMQETAAFFEREEADLFSEDGSWDYNNPNVPKDWNPAQVEKMDRKEFMQQFYFCADKLPDKIRTVFIMREVDGVKSDEICAQLEITPQNLWTILHRARMALRQCLEKNFFSN
ncbi:sigma-70 family RNA polymerase sigma factor [Cerasicoccus arenae]|uniref:RNA polymerase sigma factor n=1 Tax=Cerasicoccus arenae TaxID=424488 RepID=A0A8J3DK91_9BACT|nr:sigma-70 family RNA polymerase sigma factor [Cerasicoccus arenae]MBK1859412.1 sigma-70 family RNA polymerase sigma factor [Cerasicoccus arenae]GHC10845.1 RNA polymerase sigma factor [Cerasicoccus arenae]